MELKIPPLVVFAIFALAMYLLASFLPVGQFSFFRQEFLGKTCFALAILLFGWSFFYFKKSGTTVDPRDPSKAKNLVTNGPYRLTRNPMYLAMLLLLLSWSFKLGNVFNLLFAALFVTYMNQNQIIPEEKALAQTFGKSYKQYCLKVRRWF